jgi:hypothetical protein
LKETYQLDKKQHINQNISNITQLHLGDEVDSFNQSPTTDVVSLPHVSGQISPRTELSAGWAENLFSSRLPGVIMADHQMSDFDELLAVVAEDTASLVLPFLEVGLEERLADVALVLKVIKVLILRQ